MIHIPTQVKEALKKSVYPKNYRFRIMKKENPNELDFEIDNENLVAESVNIDEKMCSGSDLKFGLCEGSTLEFQYFGFPNITGRSVWVFIDCQYRDSDDVLKWYSIPFGRFDVKECSRQASTGIIKAVCYNKLLSQYLDEKANDKIEEMESDGLDDNLVSVYGILKNLLGDYSVTPDIPQNAIKLNGEFKRPDVLSLTPERVVHLVGSTYTMFASDVAEATYKDIITSKIFSFPKGSNNRPKRIYFKNTSKYIEVMEKIIEEAREYIEINFPDKYLEFWNYFYNESILFSRGFNFIIDGDSSVDKLLNIITIANDNIIRSIKQPSGYAEKIVMAERINELLAIDVSQMQNDLTIIIQLPFCLFRGTFNSPTFGTVEYISKYIDEAKSAINDLEVYVSTEEELYDVHLNKSDLPDVTLRQLQSAVFETQCQFGKLDRITDLFSGVTLNGDRLLPSDSLYPNDSLYPKSVSEHSTRAMYSKLWADEGNVRSFRNLIIKYKGLDEQSKETEKELTISINESGTDDYYMNDNWLLKNLLWAESDIVKYTAEMVEKMKPISWFPFEMWNTGLPYLETGDEIEVVIGDETHSSYVLQKQTKGIQNLQDTCINGTLNIF